MKHTIYLWVAVSEKKDPKIASSTYPIKMLSKEERVSVQNSIDMMVGLDWKSASSSLDKLIMAGFFEEFDLLLDALTYYEDAVDLSPDEESYLEARDEFLYRQGMLFQ